MSCNRSVTRVGTEGSCRVASTKKSFICMKSICDALDTILEVEKELNSS